MMLIVLGGCLLYILVKSVEGLTRVVEREREREILAGFLFLSPVES